MKAGALVAVAMLATAALLVTPAKAGAQVALCESCHGPEGNSASAGTPSIAAQPVTFLENQLVFFREELRVSPIMQGVAKGMKDEDITALARHFNARKAVLPATPADPARMQDGKALAAKLRCGQCHMPQFQGQGQMARLAGQREDYLLDAMRGYRDGKRTSADTTMTEVLGGTTDIDLKALAHFMAHSP